jgi:hypothetical protein
VIIAEAQDKHDTITVHMCQSLLIHRLKTEVGHIKLRTLRIILMVQPLNTKTKKISLTLHT